MMLGIANPTCDVAIAMINIIGCCMMILCVVGATGLEALIIHLMGTINELCVDGANVQMNTVCADDTPGLEAPLVNLLILCADGATRHQNLCVDGANVLPTADQRHELCADGANVVPVAVQMH